MSYDKVIFKQGEETVAIWSRKLFIVTMLFIFLLAWCGGVSFICAFLWFVF